MRAHKLVVMKLTPVGDGTHVETRFGRRFVSIDAAARLADKIGGAVYEHVSGFGLRLSTEWLAIDNPLSRRRK